MKKSKELVVAVSQVNYALQLNEIKHLLGMPVHIEKYLHELLPVISLWRKVLLSGGIYMCN